MSDRVTLRPCTFRDLPRVVEIENESFTDAYPWSEFADHLLRDRRVFVVASVEGEIVGYVLASHEAGGEGWIRSVAVVPGSRRRGVGAALMEVAMKSLAGCGRVTLLARRSNEAAKALYRKFSFTETGMVKGYYPDGEDAVTFQWTRAEH